MSFRKRTSKACDFCHLKRIKCIIEDSDECCMNCAARQISCTFLKPSNKRGPAPGTRKKQNQRKKLEYNSTLVDNLPTAVDSLLQETILPTNILASWSPSSFPLITLEKGGKAFHWTDVFFTAVHHKYPIFPIEWTRANWKSLPIFLHHILYAVTLADPYPNLSDRNYRMNEANNHFEYSKQLYQRLILTPCSLDALGVLFLAIYALFYTNDVTSGISFLHDAIRLGHMMGIYSFSDIHWISFEGRLCVLPPNYGNRFCQLFTFLTYELDLQTVTMTKKPYYLYTSQPTSLFQPLYSDPSYQYSPFYSSYLWCWRSQITYICRRITASVYGFDTPINDSIQLHVDALQSWYDSIPKWMLKDYECYSLGEVDISTDHELLVPWKVICMLSLFYCSKLRLLKGWFIQDFKNGESSSIVIECFKSAAKIDGFCEKILKLNPKFIGISPFFYHFAFVSGVFHCTSLIKEKSKETSQSIDRSIAVLNFFASFCPFAALKLEILVKLRGDLSFSEFCSLQL